MAPPSSHGHQEYRAIFANSLDAIMLSTPGGDILAANPAACALLGRTEAELCQIGRQGVVDPLDPGLAVALETRDRTGRFSGKLTFIRANGDRFPAEITTALFADSRGRPRVSLIFRDVTEREKTEVALRTSEQRFSQAFHTSPDGITITRLSDGRYLEVNEGFVALSGYEPVEVIGKTSLELGIWLEATQRAVFVQTLKEHGEVLNLAADFRFKHGLIKSTLVSARIMDVGGERCVLSTTRDMTEKKVAQELLDREKERLAESLQRTQRLESLGLLAAGIAHDFNNMLGGIFGFLELAKEGLSQGRSEKVPRYLDRALAIHGRAKALTQQLLTFSKGGAPVRKTLFLGPVLRANAAFALSGSTVTCEFNLDPGLWPCEGDENQLGQAFDNLFLNAKQAMSEGAMSEGAMSEGAVDRGGRLRVTAQNRIDPPGHLGSFVQVSVVDQGPGIVPENLPRIFDPFFTTKSTGHGLGLATVFSIVHRHGGWVDVESPPGAGATFHVFLPASRGTVVPEESPSVPRGQGRVLVMDDEDSLREVAAALLESLGYEPTTCGSGTEAVELYRREREGGRAYLAAILDLTVPGDLGGTEAAQRIRQTHPGAILIAASGYSDAPVFHRPEEFGFAGRVAKPYLKADLAELLSRVLTPTRVS